MSNAKPQSTDSNPPLWYQPPASSFEFLEAANQTEPGPDSWGYFSRDCTAGVFLWFASFEHMLQGVVQGEIRMELDCDDLDPEAQADVLKLQAIADVLANSPQETSKACHGFSAVLDLDIEWIGQFKTLTIGDNAYAREIRKTFRESFEHEGDASPIQSAERPDFIEALRTWSI